MTKWTVTVEVLTADFALVGRWDPPPFACESFGIAEVEGNQYLTATVRIASPDRAGAIAVMEDRLAEFVVGHDVVAHRVRPTGASAEHEPYLAPVRWQRAEVDGAEVDIVWDSAQPVERIDIGESESAVSITLHEEIDPTIEDLGSGIHPQRVRLRLAAPVGERALLDGSTGRAPDDLIVWEFDERARLEAMLALDLDEVEPVHVPDRIVDRE